MISMTVLIVAAVIIAIWVIIELKRMRHKLFAFFLIGLILFGYLSFTFVTRNQDVSLGTVPGLMEAGKTYVTWLSSVFINIKSVTSFAIKRDWGFNQTLNQTNQTKK